MTNPVGRPTKYKPEFCAKVIEVGEQGGWLSEMAEACDVHRNTMDVWAEEHHEFLEALSRAKQKAQATMERNGRYGITAEKFNNGQWKHMMAARHEEYRDSSKITHAADRDAPLVTQVLLAPLKTVDDNSDD